MSISKRPFSYLTIFVFLALPVLLPAILPSASEATPYKSKPPAQTTHPPSKNAPLTLEVTPKVKQGGKGTIRGTGFTPNAKVDVIFNRPDGSKSQHTGTADENGAFNGTFTVERERPAGAWTLTLVDKPSGRSIKKPFTVIPIGETVKKSTAKKQASYEPEHEQTIIERLLKYIKILLALLGLGFLLGLLYWWLFGRPPPVGETEGGEQGDNGD